MQQALHSDAVSRCVSKRRSRPRLTLRPQAGGLWAPHHQGRRRCAHRHIAARRSVRTERLLRKRELSDGGQDWSSDAEGAWRVESWLSHFTT